MSPKGCVQRIYRWWWQLQTSTEENRCSALLKMYIPCSSTLSKAMTRLPRHGFKLQIIFSMLQPQACGWASEVRRLRGHLKIDFLCISVWSSWPKEVLWVGGLLTNSVIFENLWNFTFTPQFIYKNSREQKETFPPSKTLVDFLVSWLVSVHLKTFFAFYTVSSHILKYLFWIYKFCQLLSLRKPPGLLISN